MKRTYGNLKIVFSSTRTFEINDKDETGLMKFEKRQKRQKSSSHFYSIFQTVQIWGIE